MAGYLTTQKTRLFSGSEPIVLKGVNLGGWLMMEGYILLAPNSPESHFKRNFKKILGEKKLKDFEKEFRSHFIEEDDFRDIKRKGFNCIRLPFHYRLIYDKSGKYDRLGLKILDSAILWAKKYGLYVILDMHAAPGCQNHDWHSDSSGKAALWERKGYEKRTLDIWQFLADRYKQEECIAGYDILNEAVVSDPSKLNRFYKEAMKVIRRVDKNHLFFIEGNKWATDIKCLDSFDDDKVVLSIHTYEPVNFTFNFVPHLQYPSKEHPRDLIFRHLSQYHEIAQRMSRHVLVGEFGVNYRQGYFGEPQWLDDNLKCFEDFGFSWTYWTYKAIKGATFPDGLFSYYDNPVWVNRMGPLSGWDTYSQCWNAKKKEMIESWRTCHFKENKGLMEIFKKYV